MASSIYVATLHEIHEPTSLYRQFIRESSPLMTQSSSVFIIGRRANLLRYYLDRPPQAALTFEDAWAQCRPGDAVVLSCESGKPPIPARESFLPALSVRRDAFEVSLYIR